jgi:hypothetical protein
MRHLTDAQLNDYLEPVPSAGRERVEAHVAVCAACASRLAALANVVSQLGGMPHEAEPSRDLWPGVLARLTGERRLTLSAPGRRDASGPFRDAPAPVTARSRQRRRLASACAAAAVVFAAGLAVGARWLAPTLGDGVSETAPASGDPARRGTLDAAADVQHAGTQYVVAIARLSTVGTTTEARAQGRDAALAALYAASRQLAELAPDNPDALAILRTVSASHFRHLMEGQSRGSAIVRF